MANYYIDESGTMTNKNFTQFPIFVIGIIKINNKRKLETNFKRFISKNLKALKDCDANNKMFANGKFKEIKGSELTPALKKEFVYKICTDDCIEIFYIEVENKKLTENMLKNNARSFNFLLKLFFIDHLKFYQPVNDFLMLHIDERNVKTKAKYLLEGYLNTELSLGEDLKYDVTVTYFDSSNVRGIQVADVFSNIYLSNYFTNNYNVELKFIEKNKYLKKIFYFPHKKN